MLRSTGHFLKSQGYDIKVFDLIHPRQSDGYNPFRYIREEPDVLKLMDNLVKKHHAAQGCVQRPLLGEGGNRTGFRPYAVPA